MPLSTMDSLEASRQLQQHYPDQDLTNLGTDTLFELIQNTPDITSELPQDRELQKNILKSILWDWMRLRDDAAQKVGAV